MGYKSVNNHSIKNLLSTGIYLDHSFKQCVMRSDFLFLERSRHREEARIENRRGMAGVSPEMMSRQCVNRNKNECCLLILEYCEYCGLR